MVTYWPFFALDQSFLDPQLSKDGKPYGPKRYKEIVQECWYISSTLNTSYTDVLDLAFQDRVYLIELINKRAETENKKLEELKNSRKK